MGRPQDFQDQLDEDLAWRRAEMHTILVQIRNSSGPARGAFTRAGLALLYAHWEGYTKGALTAYLKYVSRLKLRMRELQPGFVAMALAAEARSSQSPVVQRNAMIRRLVEAPEDRLRIPNKEVNTKSNLNSNVCSELFDSLGLDYAPFSTKAAMIDYKLLKARNEIAHGRWVSVEVVDYEELHREVLTLLSTMRNLVVTAVDDRSYART